MSSIESNIYRTRFTEQQRGAKIELWKVLCTYWFPKFIPPDTRLLEIGPGYCEFINAIPCREKTVIDFNSDVAQFAKAGVRCVIGEILPSLAELPEASVERVMASNVFEHFPDRHYLFSCLEHIHRILTPGGRLIILQPNFAAVKERFYDFSDHTLPLTEKGMSEIVQASGFSINYCKARFLPYTTKSRYPAWPILVRLFLLCPPAHYFLGGQMFIVAQKPAVP